MSAVATSSHIRKSQSRCDASYLVPISARRIPHLIFCLHVGLSPEQQCDHLHMSLHCGPLKWRPPNLNDNVELHSNIMKVSMLV